MKRVLAVVALLAVVLAAVPSRADVTITSTTSTNAGAMTTELSSVTYLKGMKSRMDVKGMGQDLSIFIDFAAKLQLMVNNITKEIQTLDSSFGAANMPTSAGAPAASFEPVGQTKTILGRTCTGYMLRVSVPMKVGEETLTISTTGPVWMTKDGGDVAEWMAFDRATAAAGISLSSFGQGLQAQATAEMQKVMAERGVPLEREMQIKIDGSGPMAQMMTQKANMMTMTMKVTAISTDPISDDVFVVPAGYTKK